ncbi:secreted glycosyl hydrolase [Decorospora gaudefroyi]|uniref:Secreted glycosyl hydrolase n=1 Tax=Decorospora gaudefroyi TaxID=184978 RepID=A0A6A5KWE8_9PLEO|nr:secreted glycosyl hydrolase [Decorospora gaudefroyi]
MSSLQPFNILIFSKTTGYRHDSIPTGIQMFQTLAKTTNTFTVTATEDSSTFDSLSTLSHYAVIVLLQNIGDDIFTAAQLSGLQQFVWQGGGIVAIHGAAAAMQGNEWYTKLIGASFESHPDAELGTVVLEAGKEKHFIMDGCGARERWMDEWYNFHTHPRLNSNLDILLRGDPKTFLGGKHGDDHPLVWCQEVRGGRVFFTALGHFDEAYVDGWFVEQVERGLLWAARREGEKK